jgi:hypothetical protein
MCAGDVVGIRHIDHIHNGSYDVTQTRAGLAKRRCDRGDCGHHLRVGVAIEVMIAGRRSRNKHLAPDADGASITVFILEWVARGVTGSDQRSLPQKSIAAM